MTTCNVLVNCSGPAIDLKFVSTPYFLLFLAFAFVDGLALGFLAAASDSWAFSSLCRSVTVGTTLFSSDTACTALDGLGNLGSKLVCYIISIN